MPDIILFGDINLDINAVLPGYPLYGGEVIVDEIAHQLGGSAAITALILAQIGAKPGLLACLGADTSGKELLNTLKQANVDTCCVQVDSTARTGMVYVMVTPDGERTMFTARGANKLTIARPNWKTYIQTTKWYHLSGYALLASPPNESAFYTLALSQSNDCLVSLDPSPEPALHAAEGLKALLPYIDLFLPNEQEALILSEYTNLKDAILSLLDKGAETLTVIVKRGAKGCIVANHRIYLEMPAFPIKVVNTTGAGDAFNAGIIQGQILNLNWTTTALFANLLGATVAQQMGNDIVLSDMIEFIDQHLTQPEWTTYQAALMELRTIISR